MITMVKIQLDELKIDSLSETSGVFSGVNIPMKWKHFAKKIEGFGTMSGEHNHFADSKITIRGLKEKK